MYMKVMVKGNDVKKVIEAAVNPDNFSRKLFFMNYRMLFYQNKSYTVVRILMKLKLDYDDGL